VGAVEAAVTAVTEGAAADAMAAAARVATVPAAAVMAEAAEEAQSGAEGAEAAAGPAAAASTADGGRTTTMRARTGEEVDGTREDGGRGEETTTGEAQAMREAGEATEAPLGLEEDAEEEDTDVVRNNTVFI
jgi:hypothetical protein